MNIVMINESERVYVYTKFEGSDDKSKVRVEGDGLVAVRG